MTCCTTSVREESFVSLSTDWAAIIATCPRATVFDTPEWQQTWWEHFGTGKASRILAVRSDKGQVDLIAPMSQEDGTVSFLGGTDLVDYHDFVSSDEPGRSLVKPVLDELGADPQVSRLMFESVSDLSQTLTMLPDLLSERGWKVEVEREDVAPRLQLAGSWDAYLSGLRKKDRHELRRKMRRLEASGSVEHVELTERSDVEQGMPDFFRLHRASTLEKQEFMTSDRERFFQAVAGRLADSGITRLCFLELDGVRVATSLSFVVSGTRYLYNSGYDPEYRQLAVGLLNHAFSIRRSIEDQHAVFDFMRGNEAYKYHLGASDREVFRIVASR